MSITALGFTHTSSKHNENKLRRHEPDSKTNYSKPRARRLRRASPSRRRGSMSKAHRDPQYTANRRKLLANKPDCAYCGKPNADTVDHILELDAGGDHSLDNLAPCCATCNNIKGHRYVTARNQHRQHTRHESMQKNPVRNIQQVFYANTNKTPTH